MYIRNFWIAAVVITSCLIPMAAQELPNQPMGAAYQKWLKEDVHWILTADERREFRQLATDDQRDKFVTDFWERRNPHPGSRQNTFKEEHYRRLAFANEHFAAGIEGSHTDRGRIYVVYGPPDSISKECQPGNPPQETWFYHHLQSVGDNVSVKFVDECSCGAYELKKASPAMY